MSLHEMVRQLTTYFPLRKESLGPVVNVKAYGAMGDGVTDDRLALQRAADAVRLSTSKNILYFPPGQYLTSVGAGPGGMLCAVAVGGNTTVMGAGRTATAIKLKNGQPENNQIILNYNVASATDEYITIRDLTIDGNAAGQAAIVTYANRGLYFLRCRHVLFENLLIANVRGLNAGSTANGESFDLQVSLCADVTHRNCISQGMAVSSSGFTCDSCLNVAYVACEAHDHGIGHGFTNSGCQFVTHHGCASYLNTAGYGFNTENSAYVTYHGCLAGGISPVLAGWYAANTSRGNATGFVVLGGAASAGPVRIEGCSSTNNTNDGLYVSGGTKTTVIGGDFANNGAYGIEVAGVAWQGMAVTGRPNLTGNGTAAVNLAGMGGAEPYPHGSAGQAVPASGTRFYNPFPFDCMVFIAGGTVTAITFGAGGVTGLTQGSFLVPVGGSLTLTYTVAPTTFSWATL